MTREKTLTGFLEKLRDHKPDFSSQLPEEPPEVTKAYDSIKRRYGEHNGEGPKDEDIERRLYEAYEEGELDLAKPSDLRRAPTLLFTDFTGTENRLESNKEFLVTLLALTLEKQSIILWDALISTYCFCYNPVSPLIRSIAGFLHQHVDERENELPRRWQRHPFLARLFEEEAPKTIANFILNADVPVFQAQEKMGLTGPLLGSQLMRQAYIEGAKIIKTDIEASNIEKLDRFLTWICKEQDTNQGINENAGTAALLGLVGPFREEPNITDPNTKSSTINRIKQLLRRSYGHHYLDATKWPHIKDRDDYLRVVSQWWVTDALKLFFEEIIGRHATDRWERRRRFWFNYLEEGRIDDAWVICATRPAQTAREVQNREDGLDVQCGRLKGAEAGQSVLLMKIGRLTIVEWSERGACRIWKENNPKKPAFYKEVYNQTELRSKTANFCQFHHTGRLYSWQQWIREYIERYA